MQTINYDVFHSMSSKLSATDPQNGVTGTVNVAGAVTDRAATYGAAEVLRSRLTGFGPNCERSGSAGKQ